MITAVEERFTVSFEYGELPPLPESPPVPIPKKELSE
jgi:hypothetical protein